MLEYHPFLLAVYEERSKDAMDCASLLAGDLRRWRIPFRIGISSGPVINVDTVKIKLAGAAVDDAVDACQFADLSEVLVTREVRDGLDKVDLNNLRFDPKGNFLRPRYCNLPAGPQPWHDEEPKIVIYENYGQVAGEQIVSVTIYEASQALEKIAELLAVHAASRSEFEAIKTRLAEVQAELAKPNPDRTEMFKGTGEVIKSLQPIGKAAEWFNQVVECGKTVAKFCGKHGPSILQAFGFGN